MNLDTQLHADPDRSLLRISMVGSLNTDTAAGFEATLGDAIAGDAQVVVLDMRALDYVSSAGLRVIFKAAKALKRAGRGLAVANRQPQIEKVFEILQALPDMAVFASDVELDEYLGAMQAKVRDRDS